MPRSAMETVRRRLDDVRRQRNISLALVFVGRWLLGVLVLFIFLIGAGAILDFGTSAWKAVFLLWVAGFFSLSFYVFWLYRARWESSRHFVHRVEQELPELEHRLITSLEYDQ